MKQASDNVMILDYNQYVSQYLSMYVCLFIYFHWYNDNRAWQPIRELWHETTATQQVVDNNAQ